MRRLITFALVLVTLVVASGTLAAPARPAHAQTGVIWNVEYYNNPYLSGNPKLVRQESGREFYWGGGSPGAGVPADNFSARFATDAYFSAGVYRFYILADDGVKLWIDFPPDKRPTIDSYNAPKPGTMLTADVTLSEGSHHIQVDFRENTGDAYLNVSWERLGPSGGASGPGFSAPPVTVTWPTQWTAQYFNNTYLGGNPALSRSEAAPVQNWGYAAPGSGVLADNFSARWIVYQNFEQGTYTVRVTADDGVRVNVDGVYVINEWHLATGQTYTATFPLAAGPHSIVVEYYDAGAIAHIEFRMTREGQGGYQPVTGPSATVNAYRLNVRDAPRTGSVLRTISRNEVYPVIGRTADSSWWQINANGTIGWVSGRYVTVRGGASVSVTDGGASVPTQYPSYVYGQCPGFLPSRLAPGGYGRVTPGLSNNIRAQAGLNALWIGRIPAGAIFYVVSGPVCASNTAWYQINYSGITGWTAEGQSSTYWVEPYTF